MSFKDKGREKFIEKARKAGLTEDQINDICSNIDRGFYVAAYRQLYALLKPLGKLKEDRYEILLHYFEEFEEVEDF